MTVVTLWHFSVAIPGQQKRLNACVPAILSEMALDVLRQHDPVWADPSVVQHYGWVVDGVRYRCCPRTDVAVLWHDAAA